MSAKPNPPRLIFVTGTDTGVGKTLLTALLLAHLRQSGCHALAAKPFCCGERGDVRLLRSLLSRELTPEEINPFYFPEPVAPLVAARKHGRRIELAQVIDHINDLAQRCRCLVVEGVGGLCVPLGEGYTVQDLILRLGGEVLVVSRNQLGTINHTLLTVDALQGGGVARPPGRRWLGPRISDRASRGNRTLRAKVILMEQRVRDLSAATNPALLKELIDPIPLIRIPFLPGGCGSAGTCRMRAKELKREIALILG